MPFFQRRHILSLSLAAGLTCLMRPALAGVSRVSTDRDGQAIQGYDTRAYWREATAAPGQPAHVIRWQGADWRFASAGEAALFAQTPERFAPRFGGFCTRAMSLGKVVDGDPEVWRIFEESLYLFARPKGGRVFDEAPAPMIAAAQAHWDNLS